MKRVLVIEDNADNLFLITRALQRAGYEVLAAGCTGYFEKPIDPLTIVAQIEKIAERVRVRGKET